MCPEYMELPGPQSKARAYLKRLIMETYTAKAAVCSV